MYTIVKQCLVGTGIDPNILRHDNDFCRTSKLPMKATFICRTIRNDIYGVKAVAKAYHARTMALIDIKVHPDTVMGYRQGAVVNRYGWEASPELTNHPNAQRVLFPASGSIEDFPLDAGRVKRLNNRIVPPGSPRFHVTGLSNGELREWQYVFVNGTCYVSESGRHLIPIAQEVKVMYVIFKDSSYSVPRVLNGRRR